MRRQQRQHYPETDDFAACVPEGGVTSDIHYRRRRRNYCHPAAAAAAAAAVLVAACATGIECPLFPTAAASTG